MSAQLFGDVLFSRSAWGSKELMNTFGFPSASKNTLGTVDAGFELLSFMVGKQKWVHLGDAFSQASELVRGWSPTTNYETLQGELQALWNDYNARMDGETPNEADILLSIITKVKEDFKDLTTVGRNKLRSSYLLHTLNLFKTI